MKLIIKIFILFVITFFTLNNSYSENWFTSAGNYHSSKYSALNQIDKYNVKKLKEV